MVTLGALAAVVILGVAQVMGDLLGISLFRRDSFHDWLLFAWLTVILIAAARLGVYVRRLWETVSTREEQLAAVEATSSDWMWEARVTRRPTLELTFTSCSPSVVGLLGWRPQDVVGRPMLEFVCPEHVGPARAVIADAVDKGAGWSGVELCWRHADGRAVRMLGNAVPVLDTAGAVVGFRGSRRLAPADIDVQRRLAGIRHRVDEVLAADSLAIALQPIVGLDSGRWVEVEALTRFPDDRAPDVWFAEAHEVGLGVDLEMAAVRAALRTLGQLPEGVTLAVNASPQLILDPRLARALTAPGVPTARIAVEMTEHAAVAHYEEIRQVLAPLRALGLRVAVDDTGAGYSSFSHVLTLRPDVIKLDRSLVAGVDADPARRAFITAVVLLALELGAEVTAEGVETASEQLTLATLGVDRAQGYHLARPTTEARQWQTWRGRCWASAVPMPTGRLRVG